MMPRPASRMSCAAPICSIRPRGRFICSNASACRRRLICMCPSSRTRPARSSASRRARRRWIATIPLATLAVGGAASGYRSPRAGSLDAFYAAATAEWAKRFGPLKRKKAGIAAASHTASATSRRSRLPRHPQTAQQCRQWLLRRALALGFDRFVVPLDRRRRRFIRLQEELVDRLLTRMRPFERCRAPAASRFLARMAMLAALGPGRPLVAARAVHGAAAS